MLNYAGSIQPQMAPRSLALALLANNVLPPAFEGPFRYAELGCGTGVTLAALAAVYPEADFLGIDFMPGHIAEARHLAAEAGLENVRFEEGDFATLAGEADAPGGRFDYVGLHGVYTWVSQENRDNIVRILDRWLIPGGVFYVGYNAMPGWLQYEPVRRILRDLLGAAEDMTAARRARDAVDAWLPQLGHRGLDEFWKRVSGLSDRYLIHEFASKHGGAMWSVDVVREMADAKLQRRASAALAENFDPLLFSPKKLEAIREADRLGFGDTARDIMAARSFRMDIFCRGAPRLTEADAARRLADWSVQPWAPLLQTEVREMESGKLRSLSAENAKALDTALGDEVRNVGDVIEGLSDDRRKGLQTVLIALARGEIMAVRSDEQSTAADAGAQAFNRVAARRYADGVGLPGLASPRLGTGVPVSREDLRAVLGPGDAERSDEVGAGLERLGVQLVAEDGSKAG